MEFNAESAKAIARLIVTVIAAVATTFGWSFDANLWLNIILSVVSIALLIYVCWWKNQNLTSAAQEAQKVLNELKVADKNAN